MFNFNRQKEKRLASIRAAWGKLKDSYIPMDSVRIYFDQKPKATGEPVMDDRIANDLDLDRVFEIIDRTGSRVGQQYLYDRLRRPASSPETLNKLEERIRHYQNSPAERESVQLILGDLNSKNDYCFQESVENEVLTFDYRLKKGKLQQRNAIKILEIMDYPETITHEAHELAEKMKITR